MNKFIFHGVGQGLFYSGSLGNEEYNFVYDCTKDKKCLVFSNSREETEYVTATLRQIAEKRGCLKAGGEFDLDKAAKCLIDDFRAGKLGAISLEMPQ